MVLKYYGEVPDLCEATKYYEDLFDGVVEKNNKDGHHSKILLFGQIELLLHNQRDKNLTKEKPGYYVIRFLDKELSIFHEAVKKAKGNASLDIEFDITKGS